MKKKQQPLAFKSRNELIDGIVELREQRDELLEACKMLLKFLEYVTCGDISQEYDQAERAIAKAEGRDDA